jgi:hypothetical protein
MKKAGLKLILIIDSIPIPNSSEEPEDFKLLWIIPSKCSGKIVRRADSIDDNHTSVLSMILSPLVRPVITPITATIIARISQKFGEDFGISELYCPIILL